jgi:hypothetical protein
VEGDPNLLWGRSPHLEEARSGFWKGERASEGRGCFERGTLNADRKANRKGAALFNGLLSRREFKKPAQKTRSVHSPVGGKNDKDNCSTDAYRSAHRLAFAIVLRM